MSPDELIKERIIKQPFFMDNLAVYDDKPAVFYSQVPDSQDPGWAGSKYPYIGFLIDKQPDYEKKSAGTVLFSVRSTEGCLSPRHIEIAVKEVFLDLFISPEGSDPFHLVWRISEPVIKNKTDENPIYGMDITFDIIEFPKSRPVEPDPVMALYQAVRNWNENIKKISVDDLGEYYKPLEDEPVIYINAEKMSRKSETGFVSWITAELKIHVCASSAEENIYWIRRLHDFICVESEFIMSDDSAMRVSAELENETDYLKTGQLKVTADFGILKPQNRNAGRLENWKIKVQSAKTT